MDSSKPAPDALGILLAAFGTSIDEAREGYDVIEAESRALYPRAEVRFGFTSRKVRRNLRRRGLDAPNAADALAEMAKAGVRAVAVQSLHTVPGIEHGQLVKECDQAARDLDGKLQIAHGGPLLSSAEDTARAAKSALDYAPATEPGEAVAFVAHGTCSQGHACYLELGNLLRKLDKRIFLGVLEGSPTPEDVAREIKQAGYAKAVLTPFMCVPGYHLKDIDAEAADSWRSRFAAQAVPARVVIQGLSNHPGFRQIWLDHLKKAVSSLTP